MVESTVRRRRLKQMVGTVVTVLVTTTWPF